MTATFMPKAEMDAFMRTTTPARHDPVETSRASTFPTLQVVRPESPRPTLASYLASVEAFLLRYVAFSSEHESVAIALWIAHAWVVDQFEVSPILLVTSAEMRSGKSRTLDCIRLFVPNPEVMLTPSEASIYTLLSQRPRPTLLLDEADAIFGPRTADRYEGLRAILNSGNQQGTTVPRVSMEGKKRVLERFDIFGPKVVAGIGSMPSTIADRSIPIRMKRRTASETLGRFRRRSAQAEADQIVMDWTTVTLVTDVTVPDELNDRAADSWEAPIAIAEAAGGDWPTRARLAAIALSAEEEVSASVGMKLLADVRDVFAELDHLPTSDLLSRLHDLEESPWGEWYGKPLTARGLAKLLEPYRVGPQLRRLGGDRRRGYFRSDFTDAWGRYVPEPVTTVTPVPTTTPWDTDDDAGATRPKTARICPACQLAHPVGTTCAP
jgi:hypothetical protein